MNIIQAEIQSLREANHLDELKAWLSSPDPSTNFTQALGCRLEGTGQWLLQSQEYSTWRTEKNSFLWLRGKTGCGKTILASTLIEDLDKLERSATPSPYLLYFYFDFNDTKKQNFKHALCSLIIQLYHKVEIARRPLNSLYLHHNDGSQPTIRSLEDIFRDMAREAGTLWVVLDALDECVIRRESSNRGLLPWIRSLTEPEINIHLLVTSRPEQDIEWSIRNWARSRDIVSLQSDAVDKDIYKYIKTRLKEDELLRWRSQPEVETEIENELMKKADGM